MVTDNSVHVLCVRSMFCLLWCFEIWRTMGQIQVVNLIMNGGLMVSRNFTHGSYEKKRFSQILFTCKSTPHMHRYPPASSYSCTLIHFTSNFKDMFYSVQCGCIDFYDNNLANVQCLVVLTVKPIHNEV